MRPSRSAWAFAIAALAALACAATASAAHVDYKVHTTADGQAAARAAVLSVLDLGSGWKGGPVKPDLTNDTRCPNYNPKDSDLVRIGAAATRFTQPGMDVRSDAQVLANAKMVNLDWQRSVGSRTYLACARATLKQAAAKGKTRFISVRPIAIPRIGDRSLAFRVILDVKTKDGRVIRAAVDSVAVIRGDTEIALTTTMPLASAPTLFENELVLARLLVARVRS
jgi:hypothetical protein